MPGIGIGIGLPFKRQGERLGPELATGWNTSAWWDSVAVGWTFTEGVSASCDGTSGFLTKNGFWTASKTYRVVITNIRTSGNLRPPYDGGGTFEVINTTTTTTYDTTPTGPSMFIYSQSYDGDVTALSIKEVL